MNQAWIDKWRRILGPGILFASTCIGVSHLVQSTRAGALAGFGLVWAVVAANAAKYPFFEFGSRYASVKGKSLIEGYRTLGKAAPWVYLLLTVGTCFFVTAAVGMVTASFLDNLLGVSAATGEALTPHVAVALFVACTVILWAGRFNTLDKLIKVVAFFLVSSTVVAVVCAVASPPAANPSVVPPAFDWTTPTGLAFLIALMGWMPSAVDLSTWNSIWTLEKAQTSGHRPSLRETLNEFNLGYGVSAVLAIGFLTLGALLLHRTGSTLPSGSAGFASGIVNLYAESMGAWSAPVMGMAAFCAMLSTCIAVLDGYARALNHSWATARGSQPSEAMQRGALVLNAGGGLAILLVFSGQIKPLLDLATTLSFLVAPVIAYWNLTLVTRPDFEGRPGRGLVAWAWVGLAFLTAFSALYAWVIWLA